MNCFLKLVLITNLEYLVIIYISQKAYTMSPIHIILIPNGIVTIKIITAIIFFKISAFNK